MDRRKSYGKCTGNLLPFILPLILGIFYSVHGVIGALLARKNLLCCGLSAPILCELLDAFSEYMFPFKHSVTTELGYQLF